MLNRYAVAIRGAVPGDIVDRVAAVHASAILQHQAGLRPSADGRDARTHSSVGQIQHQEEGYDAIEMR